MLPAPFPYHRSLPNPNALDAVSKGKHVVKLCSSKIFHFLTGCQIMQVVLDNGRKTVVVAAAAAATAIAVNTTCISSSLGLLLQ